jgi:hypothetical protein
VHERGVLVGRCKEMYNGSREVMWNEFKKLRQGLQKSKGTTVGEVMRTAVTVSPNEDVMVRSPLCPSLSFSPVCCTLSHACVCVCVWCVHAYLGSGVSGGSGAFPLYAGLSLIV